MPGPPARSGDALPTMTTDFGLMNLGEALLTLAQLGTEWVLWLLLGLSVVSFAIMLERGWFFWKRRLNGDELAKQIFHLFRSADLAKARAALVRHNSAECQVLAAGLIKADAGLQAAASAMQSARWRERIRMECNLGLLAAVATSAPLIGVLGTVLGVIGLLDALAQTPPAESGLAEPLMGGIALALVTSAAGFAVAIPAAAASHLFARRVRSTLAQIDSLVQLVLSQMTPAVPARDDLAEQTSKAA